MGDLFALISAVSLLYFVKTCDSSATIFRNNTKAVVMEQLV